MGEEKPDEELMGKRKSSPRLSTASFDADTFMISFLGNFIHGFRANVLGKWPGMWYYKQRWQIEKGIKRMRVISGTAKGRSLKAVPGMGTRPTTDKVKEAIFSMIGPYFDGGAVLDLFAGTGGLGIEALSRGMEKAVFVDMDKRSNDIVRENLTVCRLLESAEVYRNDAERALKVLAKKEARFDLVFLDPPYRLKTADKLMEEMRSLKLLNDDAVILVEHASDYRYPESFGPFSCRRLALYGETAVAIYDFKEEDL
jgi:16S rRNA (guanine966-N2)-methyltransferase